MFGAVTLLNCECANIPRHKPPRFFELDRTHPRLLTNRAHLVSCTSQHPQDTHQSPQTMRLGKCSMSNRPLHLATRWTEKKRTLLIDRRKQLILPIQVERQMSQGLPEPLMFSSLTHFCSHYSSDRISKLLVFYERRETVDERRRSRTSVVVSKNQMSEY